MGEVRIVGTEGPGGLELRTRGLAARGLPELRVAGLPPYLGQGWARVLAALARRLAETNGEISAERELELELAPGVAVRLAAEGDEVLVPCPPRAYEGSDADWHREILIRLFPAARS